MTERSEPWHLDKRVPLAIIFAIAGQTITLLWFVAQLFFRVDVIEQRQADQQIQIDKEQEQVSALNTNIAVIDERTSTLLEVSRQISIKVDQMMKDLP